MFSVQIQKASKNLNLVSHFDGSSEVTFIGVVLFFHVFLSFSVLFHFFLSLLTKRILLSWQFIKIFLPTLTSLKYVHLNKLKAINILCKLRWNVSFGRKKLLIFVNRVIESYSRPIKAKWRKIKLEWSSPLKYLRKIFRFVSNFPIFH